MRGTGLQYTLLEHCLSDFHEACDVGALHVVDVTVLLLAELHASVVDACHDEVEFLVHLFARPESRRCTSCCCRTASNTTALQ